MNSDIVYNQENWFFKEHDGRKRMFRGITKAEFNAARDKHLLRMWKHGSNESEHSKRVDMLDYFSQIPYEYEGDGWDDYNKYQRPSRDGKGYVAICPGESCNNVYVDDKILVALLTKRYEEYRKRKKNI